MKLSQEQSRSERSNRIFPALMAFWFAFCLANLHQDGLSRFSMMTAIDAAVGLICCVVWLVSTPPRLEELNLTRLWTVALAAPFAVAIFAIWKGWSAVLWLALLIAVSAQFVLYFLSSHKVVPTSHSANSGEPAA